MATDPKPTAADKAAETEVREALAAYLRSTMKDFELQEQPDCAAIIARHMREGREEAKKMRNLLQVEADRSCYLRARRNDCRCLSCTARRVTTAYDEATKGGK